MFLLAEIKSLFWRKIYYARWCFSSSKPKELSLWEIIVLNSINHKLKMRSEFNVSSFRYSQFKLLIDSLHSLKCLLCVVSSSSDRLSLLMHTCKIHQQIFKLHNILYYKYFYCYSHFVQRLCCVIFFGAFAGGFIGRLLWIHCV